MKKPNHSWLSAVVSGFTAFTSPFLSCCTVKTSYQKDSRHKIEISIPEQRLALFKEGRLVRTYPISTSKFGIGDDKGSYKTPLGRLEVADKIGSGKPTGAVFKSREWTGEVLEPNAPGRDPIVSRILWLHGLEKQNKNAYSRCIYIHGTTEEETIGQESSYGCVRMKSRDIVDLFDHVAWGTPVEIMNRTLRAAETTTVPGSLEGQHAIPELAEN